MKRARSNGSSKRRLTWASLGGSQESEDYKCSDEAPGSPCLAVGSPGAAVLGTIFSTPTAQVQALEVSDRAVVKSPIIDGALFFEGRRKARVLGRLGRTAAAGAPEVPQETAAAGAAAAQRASSSDVQLQQDDVQDAAAVQCAKALAAANSSSRGCLDLLCWGVALDQQQQAADSPVTPAAAQGGALPGPPRKQAIGALPGGMLRCDCRTARALPGLAPADELQLQAVRSWLAVQRV